MATYTRRDIVNRVLERIDVPEFYAKEVVESVLESMAEMLMEDSSHTRIELRKFGVFEVKPTKAKPRARNPKTNVEVFVPARRKVQFKPGKVMREVLKREWVE